MLGKMFKFVQLEQGQNVFTEGDAGDDSSVVVAAVGLSDDARTTATLVAPPEFIPYADFNVEIARSTS